jgi:hypothetical protein
MAGAFRSKSRKGSRRLPKSLGDILPGFEGRFWSLVNRGTADQCWPWLGAVGKTGGAWAVFRPCLGVEVRAHRAAYFFRYGPFRETDLICPCINRACVNPAHLTLATRAGKAALARLARRKLNPAQVRSIYLDPRSAVEVAAEYRVTPSQLTCIRRRRTWAEVTADLPAVPRDARGRAGVTPMRHPTSSNLQDSVS